MFSKGLLFKVVKSRDYVVKELRKIVYFSPVHRIIFFLSHWLLSNDTIVEKMDLGDRGINPVAMTIIDPRKEYWLSQGSNQRPLALKPCAP